TTIIPMPDPTMQAYHVSVDSQHNVWGNLWTSDRLFKFDPGLQQVDHVRSAGSWHGNPSHLVARARWEIADHRAGLSFQPDGRHDRAQRSGTESPGGSSEINCSREIGRAHV